MLSVEKGNGALIKVINACSDKGWIVSMPLGDGYPYDLVVDNGTKILRCQVKHARFENGCAVFNVRSNNGRWYRKGEESRLYTGKIDVFGVYCSAVNQVFFVPIEDTGKSAKHLRILPISSKSTVKANETNVVNAALYRIDSSETIH